MEHEEKIKYMNIAAGVCGYRLTDEQMDLLISTYELVIEKQGETNIKEILEMENEVKQRADLKSKQDILDKVSTKISETRMTEKRKKKHGKG